MTLPSFAGRSVSHAFSAPAALAGQGPHDPPRPRRSCSPSRSCGRTSPRPSGCAAALRARTRCPGRESSRCRQRRSAARRDGVAGAAPVGGGAGDVHALLGQPAPEERREASLMTSALILVPSGVCPRVPVPPLTSINSLALPSELMVTGLPAGRRLWSWQPAPRERANRMTPRRGLPTGQRACGVGRTPRRRRCVDRYALLPEPQWAGLTTPEQPPVKRHRPGSQTRHRPCRLPPARARRQPDRMGRPAYRGVRGVGRRTPPYKRRHVRAGEIHSGGVRWKSGRASGLVSQSAR